MRSRLIGSDAGMFLAFPRIHVERRMSLFRQHALQHLEIDRTSNERATQGISADATIMGHILNCPREYQIKSTAAMYNVYKYPCTCIQAASLALLPWHLIDALPCNLFQTC